MSFNKVLLIGRISNEPRMFVTSSNVNYVRFNIAIDRKNTTNNLTDYIPLTAWRESASFIMNNLKKGDLIFIEGKLQTYLSKENQTILDVQIDNFQALETREQRELRRNKRPSYNPSSGINYYQNNFSGNFGNNSPNDEENIDKPNGFIDLTDLGSYSNYENNKKAAEQIKKNNDVSDFYVDYEDEDENSIETY
ncbi:Single-stranded DNA-binding protein [Mycoplasmopsis meleagridis]|uniref:Single-stranded DNA-binding protein n=1 Tax=Mycoplasmopsis meleagridis ATCC 25294 TaxID=1264554 RepID=A0A0F5H0G2_9BACT|nr:single-stranded DNA-binding protein [Mycoplasmopsis meleagridis]KKB26615.1 Single-stranded DNA-binding protein [Mycoplasmopsis meleagridis ATCC 25294]OAD18486.1 Single-stranded DNA-binding protein [Mycoplasmopsis meleagridis]VEU77645.1 single-stranded DNA-binding protein [Mycoplasmopsis meleagridis]